MSNLIITTAVGYRPADIWTFLSSVERYCPSATIVAIVHRCDVSKLQPCCERFASLVLYPIETPYKPLQFAQGLIPKLRRVLARIRTRLVVFLERCGWRLTFLDERPNHLGMSSQQLFILNRRFFLARKIIRERLNAYSSVMLADSRDVVLQSDPFISMGSELHTGKEYRVLGESPINAEWIRATYGEAGFQALKHKYVICSGVTIGSAEAVLAYLDSFCDEVARYVCKVRTHLVPIWDQAYHNYILHMSPPSALQLMPWNSDLSTVGEVPPEYLMIQKDGRVSVGSCVPSILHQYDRHSSATTAVALTYSSLNE